MDIPSLLAKEFNLKKNHVDQIIDLRDQGNTIPFIARYRKELTGGIDDQVLRKLCDRLDALRALDERREDIIRLIQEQDKMTDEIMQSLMDATTLTALDDIYRPFRPKRKTRASVAIEKGLMPLAEALLKKNISSQELLAMAQSCVSEEKGVDHVDDAFAGARDILAERAGDDPQLRDKLRRLLFQTGMLVSKKKGEEASVYEAYYDYKENIRQIPGHRILAINRGEKQGFLSVKLEMDDALAAEHIRMFFDPGHVTDSYIQEVSKDAWKRLVLPSLTTEIRASLTEQAQDRALEIFAANLHSLLMVPPLRGFTVLAIDPAFRTGCKLAVVDPTGKLLHTQVIYPTPPQNKVKEASDILMQCVNTFNVDTIAIGNGTASAETRAFVSEAIKTHALDVKVFMVNESGASVYSASELAAQEFPQLDLTQRSAVSIARRLQDPLAEYVKIDPKSIGVGQYQHDMHAGNLSHRLAGVVESCVNDVGVDLNTASPSLLSYISGISTPVAKNIVAYREKNGAFKSRKQLTEVARLGPKVFEQCAGFLRVPDGIEPLDNTRIHPESYDVARKVMQAQKPYRIEDLAVTFSVGVPTLKDIVAALENPGYDPRSQYAQPQSDSGVTDIKDLREGMTLQGVVRNVSAFGAFVDIGVHQDGLVHISEMADHYVSDPMKEVRVGQQVNVRVIQVDVPRKRISLSMKSPK